MYVTEMPLVTTLSLITGSDKISRSVPYNLVVHGTNIYSTALEKGLGFKKGNEAVS
jgi:hypothetical protein